MYPVTHAFKRQIMTLRPRRSWTEWSIQNSGEISMHSVATLKSTWSQPANLVRHQLLTSSRARCSKTQHDPNISQDRARQLCQPTGNGVQPMATPEPGTCSMAHCTHFSTCLEVLCRGFYAFHSICMVPPTPSQEVCHWTGKVTCIVSMLAQWLFAQSSRSSPFQAFTVRLDLGMIPTC